MGMEAVQPSATGQVSARKLPDKTGLHQHPIGHAKKESRPFWVEVRAMTVHKVRGGHTPVGNGPIGYLDNLATIDDQSFKVCQCIIDANE